MSQPPSGSSGSEFEDRPRPSFGQPGTTTGSSSSTGTAATANGQPFGPSSASDFGASRPGGGFGPSSASDFGPSGAQGFGGPAPGSQSGNASNVPFGSGSTTPFGSNFTNPFGSAAPGVPAGRPGPTGEPTRPDGKKKRNVGLILAIIGGVLLLIATGLGIGGVVAGAKAFGPAVSDTTASTPNGSAVTGSTSESVLTVEKTGVVFLMTTTTDAANATCGMTSDDGVKITQPNPAATTTDLDLVIGGTDYTSVDEGWLVEGQGTVKVSCTGVTEPIHALGPVGFSGTLSMLGLFLGSLAVGLLGLGLLVAGIIVMIVRASRNRRTA